MHEAVGTGRRDIDVYALVSNPRRQLTIQYLAMFDAGTSVAVRTIARVVRSVELGMSPSNVDGAEYESAYNSLIQVHLDQLDTADVVDYDDDRKRVVVQEGVHHCAALIGVGRVLLRV